MPKTSTPMRKKERDALLAPTMVRVCHLCGSDFQLGERKIDKKKCDRCHQEKKVVSTAAKNTRIRLAEKGFEGDLTTQLSAYESEVILKGEELLQAYAATMETMGFDNKDTLMTLPPPELVIDEHEATNEFSPFLKQMFLAFYVKMPRQDLMILEHLGISEKRYKQDLKKYPEFHDAIMQCDRKHLKLLEIVGFHNALNPKATSERIFLLKAGDPARYRESYKGDTFNMGQVNITVSSNIKGLGIAKNAVSGGKSQK